MTLDLKSKYVNSSGRSKEAVKNIIISTIARGVSMICSLLLVPITINYVNPTRYGIWLTLSSIISWILLFDFGLGNGLRNRFAEAKAKGDMELVRQYVSTTYYTLGAIMLVLFIVVAIANLFIDWPMVLNVDTFYAKELKWVFGIVTFLLLLCCAARLRATKRNKFRTKCF